MILVILRSVLAAGLGADRLDGLLGHEMPTAPLARKT